MIDCLPDKIFDTLVFFFQDRENYKLWHKNHISCHWKKGKDFSPGSVLIAEENLHGTLHKLGFTITSCRQNSMLEYRMLFPFSLICRGGSFEMIPKDDGTELVACLSFRGGVLLKRLFRKNIESLRTHMKEEGQNIKLFIEKTINKA